MIPGRIDRRVTLQSAVRTTDVTGGYVETWTDVARVWAQFVPLRGDDADRMHQHTAVERATWKIRYRADIHSGWRLVYDGQPYEIDSPPEQLGRRDGLLLRCRALQREALNLTPTSLDFRYSRNSQLFPVVF